MSYISTIKIALILFPILAFVITIPYMIANYRKYGSVNKLRTVIFIHLSYIYWRHTH